MRTGVNTGEVVAGDGRSGGQRFATGDAVNVAKRLEEAAPAGRDPARRDHVPARRATQSRSSRSTPLELKGKGEPVGAYRLLAIDPGAEGRARRLDSPMVGRERENAVAGQRVRPRRGRAGLPPVHRPRSSGCRQVPPGRGVPGRARRGRDGGRRTMPSLRGRDHVSGRCWRSSAGSTETNSRRRSPQRLAGNENAELIAERIGGALGLVENAGPTDETFWAVRKLFEAEARERPLRRRHRRPAMGGADTPRSRRAHRRLGSRRADPARLPRATRATRRTAELERRQVQRNLGPPRAAERDRGQQSSSRTSLAARSWQRTSRHA